MISCLPFMEPSSNEVIIPEDFGIILAQIPPFTQPVPDLLATSWLTLNTVKDMALLPYNLMIPAVNIKSPSIPGVAIGFKPEDSDTLPTKVQMWALMRCLKSAIPVLKTGVSPKCTFGYHDHPWLPGQIPKFDRPVGRLYYIKTEAGIEDDMKDPSLGTPDEESKDNIAVNDSIVTTSTDLPFFTASEDLAIPKFDAEDEINDGRPARYTASLGKSIEGKDMEPGILMSSINYAFIAMAADEVPREMIFDRSRVVNLRLGNEVIRLDYRPHESTALSDYESYVLGLVSVVWKMRHLNEWSSREFAIWRVSDQKRVIDGSILKVDVVDGGTGGVSSQMETE